METKTIYQLTGRAPLPTDEVEVQATGGGGSAKVTVAALTGLLSVSVKDYGAVGDGVTDDQAAIVAAIAAVSAAGGGRLLFPAGDYLVGASFSVPDYVILEGAGRRTSVIKRGFTGDLVTSFGGYCGLFNIGIDGQQATYGAGRGVLMSGTTPNSFMMAAAIENFSEACLEFAADSGATFRAINCEFYTTGAVGSVGAVKVTGVDTAATSRHFIGCESGGCTLYNLDGCNDLYISGGYSNGIITTDNTEKLLVVNMRIASTAGDITLRGASCRYTNVVFAVPIILEATNSQIDCEVPNQDITDNGTGNSIYTRNADFTSTWSCSGTAPDIGNGTINASFVRNGSLITAFYDVAFGSTSTYGTGSWRFSLPRVDGNGALVQLSGGGFSQVGAGSAQSFHCRITPNSGVVELFYVDAGTLTALGNASRTWANGDTIRFSLSYVTP